MTYEYDVFVSYRHTTSASTWVRESFVPELQSWLDESLPQPANVFLDSLRIRNGVNWQASLKRTIQRSKCMVAVLNGGYFSSDYCSAEWHSFAEREALLGYGTIQNPDALIFPIRYFDGNSWDLGARTPIDMSKWAITARHFKESAAYMDFQRAVQDLAVHLTRPPKGILAAPPPYQEWPVRFPDVQPPDLTIHLPRIA